MSVSHERITGAAMRLFAETGASQVSLSELAKAAGVARGTIYNNFSQPENLFEVIATDLADEMHERVASAMEGIDNPAERLSNGIRFFIRRAYDEPVWGKFIARFGLTSQSLQGMVLGQPAVDLRRGRESGHFLFEADQETQILTLVGAAAVTAMRTVLEGNQPWRRAGSDASEFVLRGLGMSRVEARRIASLELPELRVVEARRGGNSS